MAELKEIVSFMAEKIEDLIAERDEIERRHLKLSLQHQQALRKLTEYEEKKGEESHG